jgi:hypothetical protein
MLFLVLQKYGRERFAGIRLRLTLSQVPLPLADDSTDVDEEKEADCMFCTGHFPEDHNGEEWIQCVKYCRWAHTLCGGMKENIVRVSFQG